MRTNLELTILSLVRGEELSKATNASAAQVQESVMSMRQAWKAFRMGIVASGYPLPATREAEQEYWRLMRNRFRDWYASYLGGRIEKLEKAGVSLRKPFNPLPLRQGEK